MNILIVGNGFDLSHFLPTKYDHFMDVMKAIEEKSLGQSIANTFNNSTEDFPTLLMKVSEIKNTLNEKNYEMCFGELFNKCREKWFIDQTESKYDTSKINLNFKQVLEFKYLLRNNGWYQYFKDHLKEIDTWIDFENKIEEALKNYSKFMTQVENKDISSDFTGILNGAPSKIFKIDKGDLRFVNYFKFSVDEKIITNFMLSSGQVQKIESNRKNVNLDYCYGRKRENGINPSAFISYINKNLEDFIKIFNLYLELIVDNLEPKGQFEIFIKSNSLFELNENIWDQPNIIYSFNYTNTYQRMYGKTKVEYLHGVLGKNQNIVLGVSDLEDDFLKKIKAYGFTKYHQKLFKNTDYQFFDRYKKRISENNKKLIDFNENLKGENRSSFRDSLNGKIEAIKAVNMLNLNISIWGHSLDVSDKDYILDLFSLNDDMDRNVRVIVYYFNKPAKFDLLNNLLAILGKDKVEHWMKNKWLQFKENPKIITEDVITFKSLQKM